MTDQGFRSVPQPLPGPAVDPGRAQRIAEVERDWVDGWDITLRSPEDDRLARERLAAQLVAVRDWAQPHTPLPEAVPPGEWLRKNQAVLWLATCVGVVALLADLAVGAAVVALSAIAITIAYRAATSRWNRRLAVEKENNVRRGPLDLSIDQRKTSRGARLKFTHDELNLILRANSLVADIRRNRSWQSEFLDTHRVRLNLDEELRQVVNEVTKLHALRLKAGAEPPPHSPAWNTYRHHQNLFEQSESALRTRVIVLSLYLDDLRKFDGYLEQLDQVNLLQEVDLEISGLYMGIEHSNMSSQQTASMSEELAMAREAVTAIIGSLSSSQSYLQGLPR
ncbi:hypothetical protein [Rhodococcus sp. NPDC058521]|uniref:hypothetical protein n=1 Tax=Rhodococcus sp. NPDC058521 TaxID=3346536 RepID=UPI003651FE31